MWEQWLAVTTDYYTALHDGDFTAEEYASFYELAYMSFLDPNWMQTEIVRVAVELKGFGREEIVR